jgi:ubiquitin thioesterase protein OTUB1
MAELLADDAPADVDDAATAAAAAQQRNIIEAEIRANPMIGPLQRPSDVLAEIYQHADRSGFNQGIQYLTEKYDMRSVRGDGNCFYRAFLFSYLEQLLISVSSVPASPEGSEKQLKSIINEEFSRITELIETSKEDLVSIGYSEFAIESFHDMFVELLAALPSMTMESLLSTFQEDGSGDYYTWYMRALTAMYMRRNSERFYPFIDEGLQIDMKTYCEKEVEPMGRECEQIHIIALTEYLKVGIAISYLDGKPFADSLPVINFPDNDEKCSPVTVRLLYRPGHYDILYDRVQA